MSTARKRCLFFCLGLLALGSWVDVARGIPRYSARYQQDCHLCHTNPTGGGQRTLYASQFLTPTELSARFLEFEELEGIDPQLNDRILVGADVRTLFAGNDGETLGIQNFFQMQTDIYLSFTLDDRYTLYLDRGASQTLEAFGMGHVLPYNGYFKVGRFTPAYGWRIADHTAATRERMGLFPPGHTDTGLEIGLYPGNSALHLAVTNGNLGSRIDSDGEVALIGRGVHRLGLGPLSLAVGANIWHTSLADGTTLAWGGFGSARWGALVYTGEWNGRYQTPDDDREIYSMITSHELAYGIVQGVDALLTYSYFEPDIDFATGATRRYGAGVETLLHHFFQLQAMFNVHNNDPGVAAPQGDFNEVVLQAHFLY